MALECVYMPGCCVGGAVGVAMGGAYIPGYCVVGGTLYPCIGG